MAIGPNDIRWGTYAGFEGPYYPGNLHVTEASPDATFGAKVLSITTAAEGGSWSAVNMYDSGVCSVGAIQFIDAAPQCSVSDMLGLVAETCDATALNDVLSPAMVASGATFQKTKDGKWRFHLAGVPTTSRAQQNGMYFADPTSGNNKGTFTDAKRARAKLWAACMANVWTIPGAIDAQTKFTLERIVAQFVWGKTKQLLFSPGVTEDGWVGACKAVVAAFAVNSPAAAMGRVEAAVRTSKNEVLSPRWCLDVIHSMVFGAGIGIWPVRYNAKAPVASRLFGVELPGSSAELAKRAWDDPKWSGKVDAAVTTAPASDPASPTQDPAVDTAKPVADETYESSSEDAYERPVKPATPQDDPAVVRRDVGGPLMMVLNFLKMLFQLVWSKRAG